MQAQTPQNKYAEIKHHQLDCKCDQAWSILFQNTSRLYLPGLKQLSVELVAGFADFSKGTKFGKPREGCKILDKGNFFSWHTGPQISCHYE
jgi:hypothetical protein